MKTGQSITELAMALDRQNRNKRDFVVGSAAMGMGACANMFSLHGSDNSEHFNMTDLFHRQVGSALNIPSKYYDKMRSEYPSLLADNVNGWLGKSETRHTVRTLEGEARAFLSDRYRRIDNYEVAQAALPIIGEMKDARVESCQLTDKRMYIKVINARMEMEVVPGDIVQAGIVISNSEVGLGSVSVMPLLFRLVCANGMIISDFGKRKFHIGQQITENWELFSDETLQADDNAFLLKLADIVRSAVDEVKFATIVNRLRETTGAKITAPVADVVELTSKQYGFTKNESDGILQHLILGGDLSLYGLSNAVTRTANDMESYERATELETAGWQIATMENRVWKELNTV
jgi:hypothetical protein